MNRPPVQLFLASALDDRAHDWVQSQLTEARGIIADISQHRISLVILACRTVAGQSTDLIEIAEAVALWRWLDLRPLHDMVADIVREGGAV